MDIETLLSSKSTDEIKCSKCKLFLSFFPIYTKSKKNLCGRCIERSTPLENFCQNEIYEAVAKYLKFPCRFQEHGCCEMKFPEEMPKHEELCPYKTINCPVADATNCVEKIPLPNILQHCQENHADLILPEDGFEIDMSTSHQKKQLFVCKETLFMVSREFYSQVDLLRIAVCYGNGEVNKKISCNLLLKLDKRRLILEMNATHFEKITYSDIFVNALKTDSSDSLVMSANFIFEENKKDEKMEINNTEILSLLKCGICGNYALPPIYRCIKKTLAICSEICHFKHTLFCEDCSRHDNECYSDCCRKLKIFCGSDLNALANLLKFPCKYQNNGCSFIAKPDELERHWNICSYRNYECPFNENSESGCKWKGLANNVVAHVLRSHPFVSFKTGQKVSVVFKKGLKNKVCLDAHRVIRYQDHLFQIFFFQVNDRIYWEMQSIGNLAKQFTYEVELENATKCTKLMAKKICSLPVRKKTTFLNDSKSSCYFEMEQVKSFVFDDQLIFRVSICDEE